MPHRQVIAGRVRLPVVSDVVIPFQATTTFDDYEINSGRPIVFDRAAAGHRRVDAAIAPGAAPGAAGLAPGRAARAGRRDGGQPALLGLRRPLAGRPVRAAPARPNVSLEPLRRVARFALAGDRSRGRAPAARGGGRAGPAWPRRCRIRSRGRRAHGFGYERMSDLFRYNRVQGLSFGLGLPGAGAGAPVHHRLRDGALRVERRAGDRPPEPGAGRAGRPAQR